MARAVVHGRVAEMAMLRGAEVRVLAPERMPAVAAVAAIFRY